MSADPIEIRRERLADQAYEILRTRILRRDLAPGDRLSVPALATELGLSRSPVREAVQRLVAEGLGEEQVHRGAQVVSMDEEQVRDIYGLRAVLEGYAARLAASRHEPGLPDQLADVLADHQAAIDAEDEAGVVRADIAFHQRLMELADSPQLERALRPIHGRVQLTMLTGDLKAWPREAIVEHRRIAAAVLLGDGAAAEAAAADHVHCILRRRDARGQ